MNIRNYFIKLASARSFISGVGLTRLFVAGISLCLWLVSLAVSRLMGGLVALVMVAVMTITLRLRASALVGVAMVCLLIQAFLAAAGLNVHGSHAITVQLAMITFWCMVVSVALYARARIREGRTELVLTRAEVARAAAEERDLVSRLAPQPNSLRDALLVASEAPSASHAAAMTGTAIVAPQARLEYLTEKQQQRLRAHTSYLARLGADHAVVPAQKQPTLVSVSQISDIVAVPPSTTRPIKAAKRQGQLHVQPRQRMIMDIVGPATASQHAA